MGLLQGKNIILTRKDAQNHQTASLVVQYGANPIFFPCLDTQILTNTMHRALSQWGTLEKAATDIIFSSCNGVQALLSCVDNLSQTLQGFRLVAVGHQTAALLQQHGCTVNFIPQQASQQGLIASYISQGLPQQAFFFRAEQGSDILMEFFAKKQVNIQLIPCYRSVLLAENPPLVIQMLEQQNIEAVLLGSARIAEFYAQKTVHIAMPKSPVIAVMSQQVAQAADKVGLKVQVIAKESSFKAMLDGLTAYFNRNHFNNL